MKNLTDLETNQDNVSSIHKHQKTGITSNGSVTIKPDDTVVIDGFSFYGLNRDDAAKLVILRAIKTLKERYLEIS